MATLEKLDVRSARGRETDGFSISGDHGIGPLVRGSARDALAMLQEHGYYREARLMEGGRFVATLRRDGSVVRP